MHKAGSAPRGQETDTNLQVQRDVPSTALRRRYSHHMPFQPHRKLVSLGLHRSTVYISEPYRNAPGPIPSAAHAALPHIANLHQCPYPRAGKRVRAGHGSGDAASAQKFTRDKFHGGPPVHHHITDRHPVPGGRATVTNSNHNTRRGIGDCRPLSFFCSEENGPGG